MAQRGLKIHAPASENRTSPNQYSQNHHHHHHHTAQFQSLQDLPSQSQIHTTSILNNGQMSQFELADHGFGSMHCPKHGNGVAKEPKQLFEEEEKKEEEKKPLDAKEIMKKRREKAICIDRVSRNLFPCTFILLNITYWLAFSDIMSSLH